MKKHKLATMLSAAVFAVGLISMTGGTVMAEGTEVETGSCGENLTYTLDNEGVLTISGNGELVGTWNGSQFSGKNITKAVIGNEVTIGSNAFNACSSLTEITIPDGITSIGSGAFNACSSLSKITIPDSVISIGMSAFRGCSSLTEITIPSGVTSIPDNVFSGCNSLSKITIPDSVTSIGRFAFSDCISLSKIIIPDSVTFIDKRAFFNCSGLTEITIPDSVKALDSTFENCTGLREAVIASDSLAYTFSGCSNLEKVTLLNSVTDIAYQVFLTVLVCRKLKYQQA